MTNKTIDVVAIGNAIVDILAYKDEAFLEEQGFPKGSMQLIDEKQAEALTEIFGSATECSGGSAANTLAGIGLLGGKSEFIGKVHNDQLGTIFRKELNRVDVEFNTPAAKDGDPTARCLIMVTEEPNPYGGAAKVERTMATYLGAAGNVTKDDIDADAIKAAKVLFFEGYLWDSPSAKEAIRYAIEIAKEAGTKVSFTLSDSFCVERHHDEFVELVKNDIDILFCNEPEAKALTGGTDVRSILNGLGEQCEIVLVTRSEKGSYICNNGEVHSIDAEKVDNVFDVTGAGDLYAAGFLYGYVNDYDMEKSGKLASKCAAAVIQYLGGRPMTKISELLDEL